MGSVATSSDRQFTIVLEPQSEGGFLVLVPSLPEVVTYGATEAEALSMAHDAIRLAMSYRRSQGEELPSDSAARNGWNRGAPPRRRAGDARSR
jgi:antitoxin HicB